MQLSGTPARDFPPTLLSFLFSNKNIIKIQSSGIKKGCTMQPLRVNLNDIIFHYRLQHDFLISDPV